MALSGSVFDTLPARPPTPPRDLDRDINAALDYLDDSFGTKKAVTYSLGRPLPVFSPAPLDTPLDTPSECSPSSSAEPVNGYFTKKRKRVGFSPWMNFHKASDTAHQGSSTPLKPVPPHRDRRSLKSILKPYEPPPVTQLGDPSSSEPSTCSARKFQSFSEMLESVVQQLAGQSRDHRLDAYIALIGPLKAYEDIPDIHALQSKLGLLTQFIQRDVVAVTASAGALDTVLITQALKVLMALMRIPPVAQKLNQEFCAFIVDRSIDVLEDGTLPKAVVNHHLYLLGQQDFSRKVMTNERAGRLLDTLQTMEIRVKGNNLVGSRLVIYKRLLEQNSTMMLSRIIGKKGDDRPPEDADQRSSPGVPASATTEQWLEHAFHGMLSSINEIRNRGIELGMLAGLYLGSRSDASKAVINLLRRDSSTGISYGDYLARRFSKMLADKDEAQHVPQIWSVVILFLRGKRQKLQQWQHLKQWLSLIQECFNAPDMYTKYQAYMAWNRFVFVVNPDEYTTSAMISLLRQPILAQIERRGNDKTTRQVKQIAFSSYCNLLYYALRPSPPGQLGLYWDQYVVPVVNKMISLSARDASNACRVLTALFGGYASACLPWNESRANEPKTVKPEELPRLDACWIRLNMSRVLSVVRLCLDATSSNFMAEDQAHARSMWSSLMSAVAEAGNKEIKASLDLKQAIAHVTNLLHGLWTRRTQDVIHDASIIRFSFLAQVAIEKLGPMHFAERILTRNAQAEFEAAPTPSHRSRALSALQSPLLHLIGLLLVPTCLQEAASAYHALVRTLLIPCCASRSTRLLKLELLKDCAQAISDYTPATSVAGTKAGFDKLPAAPLVWRAIIQTTVDALSDCGPGQQLGHEYELVTEIIRLGLHYLDDQNIEAAEGLHRALVDAVTREAGDGPVILAVTEPLSAMLSQVPASDPSTRSLILDSALFHASLVLADGPHYRSRRTMESARKALWGGASTAASTAELDSYDTLYKMTTQLSLDAYESLQPYNHGIVMRFLRQLSGFLQRCPLSHSAVLMRKMQSSITPWIEDLERKLSRRHGGHQELREVVLKLWTTVTSVISNLPRKDNTLLEALEDLVLAGFTSRRRAIVDETVIIWNSSFGLEADEYSPSLMKKLRKLSFRYDFKLAGSVTGDANDSPASSLSPESEDVKSSTKRTPRRERPQTFFTAVASSPVSGSGLKIRASTVGATAAHSPARIATSDFDSSPTPRPKASSSRVVDSFGGEGPITSTSSLQLHGLFDAIPSSSPVPASVSRKYQTIEHAAGTSMPGAAESVHTEDLSDDPPSSPPAVEQEHETAMSFSQSGVSVPAGVFASAGKEHEVDDKHHLGGARAPVSSIVEATAGSEHAGQATASADKEHYTMDSHLPSPTASIVNATGDLEQGSVDDSLSSTQVATEFAASEQGTGPLAKAAMPSQLKPSSAFEGDTTISASFQSGIYIDAPVERFSSDNNEPDIFVDASQVPLPPSDNATNDVEMQSSQNLPLALDTAQTQQRSSALRKTMGSPNHITRVTNSFGSTSIKSASDTPAVSTKDADAGPSSQLLTNDSQITPQSTRKRKRSSHAGSRKRSKNTSPLKQLMSAVFSRTADPTEAEEEGDEDIEDCVVVASQPPEQTTSHSLLSEPKATPASKKRRLSMTSSSPVRQSAPVLETSAAAEPSASQRKRRSRPSAATDEEQGGAVVKDTPAPKRLRLSSSPQASSPQANVLSHVEIQICSKHRDPHPLRQSSAPPDQDEGGTTISPDGDEEEELALPSVIMKGPESEAPVSTSSQTPATPSRRILNPRSIIDKLRGILTDCQRLVLGSQEEREMDDVLFEVRREVHEAGRRGRSG